jgi:hypothetical protein
MHDLWRAPLIFRPHLHLQRLLWSNVGSEYSFPPLPVQRAPGLELSQAAGIQRPTFEMYVSNLHRFIFYWNVSRQIYYIWNVQEMLTLHYLPDSWLRSFVEKRCRSYSIKFSNTHLKQKKVYKFQCVIILRHSNSTKNDVCDLRVTSWSNLRERQAKFRPILKRGCKRYLQIWYYTRCSSYVMWDYLNNFQRLEFPVIIHYIATTIFSPLHLQFQNKFMDKQ